MMDDISKAVREGRWTAGPHTWLRQLDHDITSDEIEMAVGYDAPEIIEDYPEDPRGHSCLIRAEVNREVIHVVCTVDDPVFLISCYRPDPVLWYPDYRRRR